MENLRCQQEVTAAAATAAPLNYGHIPLVELQSKTPVNVNDWTSIEALNNSLENKPVQIRGWLQTIRCKKMITFLVIRETSFTVQCVVDSQSQPALVKFAAALSKESIVDVQGVVSIPPSPIKGATQQVEIQVRKLYCVSKAATLPINIEDAARSEFEIEEAIQAGKQLARVKQDTRLNFRVLDLRTPANQAIFRIQSRVGNEFRKFLLDKNFVEIHTPKLIAGSSEGGADVFRLEYHGQPACLAQSPQLHKQMSICAGFERVFEIGPVFRAEKSFTHRHLCEFTGLDVEMAIKMHYFEVMDVVDELFVAIFNSLKTNCKKDLEAVATYKPLKYLQNTLRLTYEEGIQMLKEDGVVEVKPYGDLNTEAEKRLGQLVLEKHDTEFYILHRYPLAVRPFYTMPCDDNPNYSNSFDVFLRGEEIISGSQRIHELKLLEERAQKCGIDITTIATYLDAF
ncbi:aspartate-tRNA ligase cytoplasmic-like, partial [Trifolium pratense]